MISEKHLIETVTELTLEDLQRWLDKGLVQPKRRAGARFYREIDVARVRLIVEMREDFEVHADNIPLVMSLIDQIHGLRHQLRRLASAIDRQPESIRHDIRRDLESGDS